MLGCSLLALTLAISACAMNREQTGTVLGGAVGAAAGSSIGSGSGRTAATIVGGLIGAFAGRSVGQHMDQQDRMQTAMAMENNATGKSSTWTNPDSGAAYSVTPTRTYDSGGAPCREFTMAATVDGKPDEVRGTASRQADGNWKIIES
ncbi:MAG: RT0821/Lpp0805 family surface protein [Pseudomonadota bacterium]|nr:RT0821/Lpp0805 family surface protein [Pseudomonadota bacterium]